MPHPPMTGDAPSPSPRWVVFDAVGTLIYPDPPVAEIYHRVAGQHGSQLTREQIAARFRSAFRALESNEVGDRRNWQNPDRLKTSESHERLCWENIVAATICDADDCFPELFEHFARPEAWACYPDVAPALGALGAAGYRLAVATNFDARFERLVREMPQLAPIEQSVISSLAGYRKPSRFFFESLVETLACPAEEILLVGDDWENDIEGGRLAGLQVMHLVRNGQDRAADWITSLIDLPVLLASR